MVLCEDHQEDLACTQINNNFHQENVTYDHKSLAQDVIVKYQIYDFHIKFVSFNIFSLSHACNQIITFILMYLCIFVNVFFLLISLFKILYYFYYIFYPLFTHLNLMYFKIATLSLTMTFFHL